ncbi:MAG: sensor histidine kinase [Bacillota bacterium]|nr:sensor histidine kinase [Bacillota bacterium]
MEGPTANKQSFSNFDDIKILDNIIKQTIEAIEKGKEQIFDIAEQARQEYERVQREVRELQEQVVSIIKEVDNLENLERRSRHRLMEVSRAFEKYTEQDIKEAYDTANNFQVELSIKREQEKHIREKRNELERSLKKLNEMVEKAEGLVSQVGLVLKLLGNNLQGISDKIEGVQQLQQMGFKIIQAQEEERKRVAREIHDGPAQAMANIVMRAEVCERMLAVKPEKVAEELQELKRLIRESLQDLRKVIFDLRPMALDDLGVVPTLKRYLSDFQEKYRIYTEFHFRGQEQRFSSSIEVAIFRTVQEALTNIKKHAEASQVHVNLEFTKTKVNLIIKDDGKGFDLDQTLRDVDRENYGLVSMRERIELLEGEIKMSSKIKKGTEIKVVIPIKD